MNLRIGSFVIMLVCFAGTARAGIPDGQDVEEDRAEIKSPVESTQSQELAEIIRATRQLAEQSQAELKRSREQNENLQRLLEQTRQELILLREEVSLLRSGALSGQKNVTSTPLPETRDQSIGESSGRTPVPAKPEDLAARVTRVEDQVDLNTAQIKEHAETKVESDSRFKVTLFGMVLNNTYFNTSDSSENAVPTAAPPVPASESGHNLGATLRQTQFGFSVTGPKLGTARLSAAVDFDFFGGADETDYGSVLGALRMRTASARIDGPRTSLAIGLMSPMVSPLNPTSMAAVSYPALGESGNLWQWRPQMTVERRIPIRDGDDFILEGGLMMPSGETVNGTPLQGRPGYETRIAFARRRDADRRLEIGVGGYFYPQVLGFAHTVDSYAATSDWLIPLSHRLTLSGEAFYGQSISLGEESGGDIADVFAFNGPLDDPLTTVRGIHSAGGWAQLNAKATPKLEFNLAFGLADPRNRDVFAGLFNQATILKNQTISVNSIYYLRSDFAVSLEYRHLWTTYPNAVSMNDHVNLAIGYFF